MSVKELVLIAKQKYNHLTENEAKTNTASVQTQTEAEEVKTQEVNNTTTNSANNYNNKTLQLPLENVTGSVHTVQAVRSPSWNIIPGIRIKRKTGRTKKVKWIPY